MLQRHQTPLVKFVYLLISSFLKPTKNTLSHKKQLIYFTINIIKRTSRKSTLCRQLQNIRKGNNIGVWVPHVVIEKNYADRLATATTILLQQRINP